MHNEFSHANFVVRQALYDHKHAYGSVETVPREAKRELQATIGQAAKEVVDYMLFCDEAPLESDVSGSILFTSDFVRRGPRDAEGRSLRVFDLQTRLFQYPCSYLIYSPAFDSLEDSLREQIYQQLWDVLTSDTPASDYRHLDQDVRTSILEILHETKTGLPDYWKLGAKRKSKQKG